MASEFIKIIGSIQLIPSQSICEIEIRATHKIMAARTTQFALLVNQLVAALQAKPPMLAGNICG